jgi:hypothetical protein
VRCTANTQIRAAPELQSAQPDCGPACTVPSLYGCMPQCCCFTALPARCRTALAALSAAAAASIRAGLGGCATAAVLVRGGYGGSGSGSPPVHRYMLPPLSHQPLQCHVPPALRGPIATDRCTSTVGVRGQASCLTYPPPSSTHRQFTGGSFFFCTSNTGTTAATGAAATAAPCRATDHCSANTATSAVALHAQCLHGMGACCIKWHGRHTSLCGLPILSTDSTAAGRGGCGCGVLPPHRYMLALTLTLCARLRPCMHSVYMVWVHAVSSGMAHIPLWPSHLER